MENRPSKLVPALIGGGIIGVLSAIPIVNMGNCLCCMWVLLGGAIAAYVYSRDIPPDQEFGSGDAAIVGLLAGCFGALFGTLLSYFFMTVLGQMPWQDIVNQILESDTDLPPEFEDMLEGIEETGSMGFMFVFIQLFFGIIINALFGTLGGLLGKAISGKKSQG